MDLPEISGSQLLRYFEQESFETEIIVLTREATEERRVDAVSHGAFVVVQRPFETDALLTIVDRPLRRSGGHN